MNLPLRDIRVVDLTRALAGPFCTALLADLGADVVKIEPLPDGDITRSWPPYDAGASLYFASVNRNKRSIGVDLRSPEGLALLRRLVADADVLVENFRPGVLAELGLDPQRLRAEQPGLVVASVSGFGPAGPYRDLPGLDQIAQGMSGLMSVTGFAGQVPTRVGIPIIDMVAGIVATAGITASLAGRARGGTGAHVQTSLLESALSVMIFQAQRFLSLGEVATPEGNNHPVMAPYGTFRTQDGLVNLAVSGIGQWRTLCGVLGEPSLAARPEFADVPGLAAHRAEVHAEVERLLRQRATDAWIPLFRAAGIPCGPVYHLGEALTDPQVEALRMVQRPADGDQRPLLRGPLWLDGEPAGIRLSPPGLGAHTREVLTEAGLPEAEIRGLLARGVVSPGPAAREESSP